MLAGAVLPVWRKVEQVLASGEVAMLLRQADRRLPIVRAVERVDAYAETCRRCGKEESRYYTTTVDALMSVVMRLVLCSDAPSAVASSTQTLSRLQLPLSDEVRTACIDHSVANHSCAQLHLQLSLLYSTLVQNHTENMQCSQLQHAALRSIDVMHSL
jgi:hypothetical protein